MAVESQSPASMCLITYGSSQGPETCDLCGAQRGTIIGVRRFHESTGKWFVSVNKVWSRTAEQGRSNANSPFQLMLTIPLLTFPMCRHNCYISKPLIYLWLYIKIFEVGLWPCTMAGICARVSQKSLLNFSTQPFWKLMSS